MFVALYSRVMHYSNLYNPADNHCIGISGQMHEEFTANQTQRTEALYVSAYSSLVTEPCTYSSREMYLQHQIWVPTVFFIFSTVAKEMFYIM